ncbi:hypothetical protein [Streptomyces sp. NPDC047024]|uniref:hypothetical protein n=1 Tax=Streptomyces sp. NPDC047024 TaxID=3155476 RepID=UPI0033F754B9
MTREPAQNFFAQHAHEPTPDPELIFADQLDRDDPAFPDITIALVRKAMLIGKDNIDDAAIQEAIREGRAARAQREQPPAGGAIEA